MIFLETVIPGDLLEVPAPRIGFIGAVSDYKVDFNLLRCVAKARTGWSIVLYKGIPPFKIYLTLMIFMIPLWSVVFKTFGLYRPRRVSTRFSEVIDIGKVSTLAIMIFVSLTFLLRQYEFSRLTFFCFCCLTHSMPTIS